MAVAVFWAGLLGGETSEPLPGWRRVTLSGGAHPALTFQPVPEPQQGKARLHLDLVVDDLEQAVAAVVALGGRSGERRHEYPEGTVLEMADVEGHEFCIVRHT